MSVDSMPTAVVHRHPALPLFEYGGENRAERLAWVSGADHDIKESPSRMVREKVAVILA